MWGFLLFLFLTIFVISKNAMEYIVISTNSKSETAFFKDLLKKMQKKSTTLTDEEVEDMAFTIALKEAEKSPKGSLSKVKAHLSKVASSK